MEIPSAPGTEFRLLCQQSSVEVKAGGSVTVAQLKATGSWTVLQSISPKGHPVTSVHETPSAAHTPGAKLTLVVPDKWTSLVISTCGQPVSVAKVNEARLSVHTQGGPVTLGQIRAHKALINTLSATAGGGAVQGVEMSAGCVNITSGGAPVTLKRLVGQQVEVVTGGGAAAVGALYAERCHLHTGGGNLEVGTLDVSIEANVSTHGGALSILGLDGQAELCSGGGPLETHLHGKVGDVRLSTKGGAVQLAVSPQAHVDVCVMGQGQVECADADPKTNQQEGTRVFHFKPKPSEETRYGQLSEGHVVVDSQGGPVQVRLEGWMEALQQRMANKAVQQKA